MKTIAGVAAILALGAMAGTPAGWAQSQRKADGFISIKASEIKWADAPSVGPGAKIAVLEGNPKSPAHFTMRLPLPPNFKIPVHTHPAVERVTVLSGSLHFAIADRYEPARSREYKAGDGFIVPVGMPMFAFTGKSDSIIQISGTGPWGISYNNPAEDPGKKAH
jgi:quercetin dioxygenase-like cupin family protein